MIVPHRRRIVVIRARSAEALATDAAATGAGAA